MKRVVLVVGPYFQHASRYFHSSTLIRETLRTSAINQRNLAYSALACFKMGMPRDFSTALSIDLFFAEFSC